jgi:plasmid stability protein
MNPATAIDMSATWPNVSHMSKMIQIRNVPDDVHRTLKLRATAEGLSLSDYIKRDLEELAQQATIEDVFARAHARGPSGITSEEIVAGIRASRGE